MPAARTSSGEAWGACVSEALNDKVLTLWVVIANHDPEQTYVYTNPDHAFRSISDGVRAYLDPMQDQPETDDHIETLESMLRNHWGDCVIPFQIYGLYMTVQRLELDRHNHLHAVLRSAYDVLDGAGPDGRPARAEVLGRIGGLFREPLN